VEFAKRVLRQTDDVSLRSWLLFGRPSMIETPVIACGQPVGASPFVI
jgi:hypothetical protein